MSLYKAFFKIIKKNWFSVLIYFVITIGVIMLLNGVYADNESKKAKLDKYNIYVEDEDGSDYSKAVVDFLNEFHNVKETQLSQDQIKDLLFYEQIVSYIRIPKGFGDTFIETGENQIVNTYDDSMPVGIYISLQLDNYLNSIRSYVEQGDSIEEASKKAEESLDITKYVSIDAPDKQKNGTMKGNFNYLPYGILCVLIMGVFPAVVAFNQGEKKNRMQVSSMAPGKRSCWIFAGAATFSLMIFAVLVVVASALGSNTGSMPGDVSGGTTTESSSILFTETWWLAVLNVLVFTLVVAMMISMLANVPFFAKAPAAAFSNIIGLGFCFLGGTFVPLSILGDGVKKVGQFLPNYWYSTAVNRIFDGGTLADVWDCFAIQLGFGLACLFIGLAVARVSAERKQLA